uniref:Uncharacterized protein n=1 Tax=Aegilops tauschii subsp. strangulata TaxID=200361 RepID=A0A453FZ34_AEGTS
GRESMPITVLLLHTSRGEGRAQYKTASSGAGATAPHLTSPPAYETPRARAHARTVDKKQVAPPSRRARHG